MCKFFSCISDGYGSIRYFGAKERTEIEEQGNPRKYSFDSHSSICDYFEINEDKWNKYEFNPFTKDFVVDILNNTDDSAHVEKQVRDMDFNPIFETGLLSIYLTKTVNNVILPDSYLSIYFDSVKELENFTFPKECKTIDLSYCSKLVNVTFPEEVNDLYLNRLKSLNGITLPKRYKYINLFSIEKLENYTFPDKCIVINLANCVELNNVTFPEKIITLYLNKIESLDKITLPKKCHTLNLHQINSKDFIIPEDYKRVYFENITFVSSKP